MDKHEKTNIEDEVEVDQPAACLINLQATGLVRQTPDGSIKFYFRSEAKLGIWGVALAACASSLAMESGGYALRLLASSSCI